MEILSLVLFWLSGSVCGTAFMVYRIGQTTSDILPEYAAEGRKIAFHGVILTLTLLCSAIFIRSLA